jgi:hypothetical protein
LGRDRFMAGLSSAVVALMVVLGFAQLGPPSVQRQLRADAERVRQLYQLSGEVHRYWTGHGSQLPPSIDQLANGAYVDPLNHAPYEYHPQQGSHYQLCALFARSSDPREATSSSPSPWIHPAGQHCYSLDASLVLPDPAM